MRSFLTFSLCSASICAQFAVVVTAGYTHGLFGVMNGVPSGIINQGEQHSHMAILASTQCHGNGRCDHNELIFKSITFITTNSATVLQISA